MSIGKYLQEKKHICPNRGNKSSGTTTTTITTDGITPPSTAQNLRYSNLMLENEHHMPLLQSQQPKPRCQIHLNSCRDSIAEFKKNTRFCLIL